MSGQRTKAVGIVLAVTVLGATSTVARAQSQTTESTTTTTTAPPPPPPVVQVPPPVVQQPAPVVVQPSPPAVPAKQKQVVMETHSENYMATIAKSVFFGALAGGLVGTAVYFIDHENHPRNIAYWGAGGALVGGAVGLVQIAVDEHRNEQALSSMERKHARERGIAFVPTLSRRF
jgi:hypothetical protein